MPKPLFKHASKEHGIHEEGWNKKLNSKFWTQILSFCPNYPLKINLTPCGAYAPRWESLL